MKEVEDLARKYFDKSLTDRERAIFEGAITLGAIYHQFVGVPICRDEKVVKALERAIEATMKLQPYKENVKVKINLDAIKGGKSHPYDYETLKGRLMDVQVVSKYGEAKATLGMKFIPELDYTLMYVMKVEEQKSGKRL